jgi:rRNA small subunit pseudouridine methyltransferase Nep1
LNKSGKLQVFIRTKNNILIEINQKCRIPRTYRRFLGLFAELLTKLRIRAAESSEILLKTIKNPITDHIPTNIPIIATSEKTRLVDIDEYVNDFEFSKPVAFVVGAISKGDLNIDYHTDSVSVSSYPLTAAVVCSKICNAFEKNLKIL